jgi:DNA-binding transcriptional LysR family regulator
VLTWLQQQEIDASLGLLGGKPPGGIRATPMFKMPLVLLVPEDCGLNSADELWKRDPIEETLITVPSNQPICRAFENGLAKLKVDWFSSIEVSTVEMLQTYVAGGYGIGVSVRVPGQRYHPRVRLLALEGFEDLTFGVLWQGRRTVLLAAFLEKVERMARSLAANGDAGLMQL